MTAPKHAREIKGKGRYYGNCGADNCPLGDVPDPGLMSVTNAQSVIAKPALVSRLSFMLISRSLRCSTPRSMKRRIATKAKKAAHIQSGLSILKNHLTSR